MSKTEKDLQNILENKPERKSKLEEDSFIDLEMVYSFIISLITHVLILSSIWVFITYNYGSSYQKIVEQIKKQPYVDLIFNLIPGKSKKGEFSLKEAEDLFKLKEIQKNSDGP